MHDPRTAGRRTPAHAPARRARRAWSPFSPRRARHRRSGTFFSGLRTRRRPSHAPVTRPPSRRLKLLALGLLPVMLVAAGAPLAADAAQRHPAGHAHGQLQRRRHHHRAATAPPPPGPRLAAAAVRKLAGAYVVTSSRVVGTADFQVGDDYTQYSHLSADAGGNSNAVASAERLLTSMGTFQNVALMGWGSDDPEPSPGVYDWGSLDSEVDVMGTTVPVDERMITLCTAPGWMKVGGASQEWNMEDAVAPADDEAFAQLAAQVAERYDGTHRGADGRLLPKVDDFDVWNELKGYWDSTTDSWDAAGYTTMYNDVYLAIKAVRPDALVGGPYVPVGAATSTAVPSALQGPFGVVDQRVLDALAYWLQHKAGAQFVSVDGGPAVTAEDGFTAGAYFVDVVDWLRSLDDATYPGATTLPLVWAEFYPAIQSTAGTATGQEAVAIDTSNIIEAGRAGVNYMLLWEMEGDYNGANLYTGEGVWTDTVDPGGGKPTALYTALRDLHQAFPPGTTLDAVGVLGPVSALANRSTVLLVSHAATAMHVDLNGRLVRLGPYAVTVVRATKARH